MIRLVGAVLADTHDEWQAGERRNLSEGSMAKLYPERDTASVAELNSGDEHRGSPRNHHSTGTAVSSLVDHVVHPAMPPAQSRRVAI